uniref:Carboxylic ester hydrolase n=1 Tax=Ditylenchus dipsaci TaxID=166011 RepID=A0A915CNX5_9BILA
MSANNYSSSDEASSDGEISDWTDGPEENRYSLYQFEEEQIKGYEIVRKVGRLKKRKAAVVIWPFLKVKSSTSNNHSLSAVQHLIPNARIGHAHMGYERILISAFEHAHNLFIQAQQPFVQLDEYRAYGFNYTYQQDGQQFVSNASLVFPMPNLQLPVPECDCPSTPPPNGTKYPVIVWLHGGAFVYGAFRIDGWQQFARHFNSRGVIVVQIQYRLAFWGFFSLGTQTGEAGNFGLWDQTAALLFVHKHIGSFGGDLTKVTVLGDSAGGASAHALSLSHYSYFYFQQTIQSSGSLYNPWSHSLKTIEQSKNVSQQLGCYIPQIWNVLKGFGRERNSMDLLLWGPIMDQDFFIGQNISQLTKQTPIRNTMYFSTKGDGLTFTFSTGSVLSAGSFLAKTVDQQANFSKTDFYNHVTTYLGSQEAAGPNYAQIQQLFLDYYTRGSNASNLPSKFWYTRYTDAQTDGSFAAGQIVEVGYKLQLNWTQHICLFDYIHPSHVPLLGIDPTYTPHGYEYQYIMDSQPYFAFNKSDTNAVELAFTKKIVDAMASFVKTGNPSSSAVPWPAVDDPVQIKYLLVGEQVVAENTHYTEIAKLWKKVYDLGYALPISQL